MMFFYFLILVMPLIKHPLLGYMFGSLTVFKYIGAVCFIYALIYLGFRLGYPVYLRSLQARFFVLLYIIATISYFTKSVKNSELEVSPFFSYTSFVLLLFITVTVVDSVRRLRWVVFFIIGSADLASLYVLREWQKYHGISKDFRPGWVTGDPNYFTVSALIALPMAFYFFLGLKRQSGRLFCIGSLCLTMAAVTVAASRGGFLGLMLAFLFVIWNTKHRVRNIAIVATVVLSLGMAVPRSPLKRAFNPNSDDMKGVHARLIGWRAALRMIQKHPLMGIGLGNFKNSVTDYEVDEKVTNLAHNCYLEIPAESGLPALFLFLGILYTTYRSLGRVRTSSAQGGVPFLQHVALGLQAAILGAAIALFFVSAQYTKLFLLAVFLSIPLAALAKKALTFKHA